MHDYAKQPVITDMPQGTITDDHGYATKQMDRCLPPKSLFHDYCTSAMVPEEPPVYAWRFNIDNLDVQITVRNMSMTHRNTT